MTKKLRNAALHMITSNAYHMMQDYAIDEYIHPSMSASPMCAEIPWSWSFRFDSEFVQDLDPNAKRLATADELEAFFTRLFLGLL